MPFRLNCRIWGSGDVASAFVTVVYVKSRFCQQRSTLLDFGRVIRYKARFAKIRGIHGAFRGRVFASLFLAMVETQKDLKVTKILLVWPCCRRLRIPSDQADLDHG